MLEKPVTSDVMHVGFLQKIPSGHLIHDLKYFEVCPNANKKPHLQRLIL
jgi:hypothetical protein